MPDVDLRGIFFRAWSLEFEDDDDSGALGPDGYDTQDGAVNLSCIKFRAWEENDFEDDGDS